MEIQGIQVSNLPNGAHFNFMEEVAALIAAHQAAAERVAAVLAPFRAALTEEDAALKISAKSLTTDRITAADRERDRLFSLVKGIVGNWRNHPDPALAEAAARLWQSIADYAITPSMQLDRETGLLTNLVADWQSTLAAQVAALHLTETVAALAARNDEVKALTAARADEYTLRYSRNLRTARLATDDAYRALVRRINAYLELGETDTFGPIAERLNTRITGYKQQVLRQSASHTTTPGGAPDTPVTPPTGGGDAGGDNTDEDVLS